MASVRVEKGLKSSIGGLEGKAFRFRAFRAFIPEAPEERFRV